MKTKVNLRSSFLRCFIVLLTTAGSASLGLAQIASVLSQDLTLHKETVSSGMMGQGGGTIQSTVYLSSRVMKQTASDGNDFIVRFDEGKFITVDHNKRTYTELTLEQLQKAIDEIPQEMGENQEEMEAMRRMMGSVAADFSVTNQGAGETIAGYSTQKYLIAGPMQIEVLAAPELKVPAIYYDALKIHAPQNPFFDLSKLYDELKKIEGIALKEVMTLNIMGMSVTTTSVVKSVEKGPIPASTFDIPAGYKAVPLEY